jgi:hypothetical protein
LVFQVDLIDKIVLVAFGLPFLSTMAQVKAVPQEVKEVVQQDQ